MATTTITTYDRNGKVIETRTVEIPPEQANAESIVTQLTAAIATLENAYAAWPGMNNAQRFDATREGIRAVAKACRYLLQRFESD